MGDWGRNGRMRSITLRSGEGWIQAAERLGLNSRQFEDLMRENSNITQLKAGQTIRLGNLRRNDNAYVSNYTAAASGMATSGQLEQLYQQNRTDGYRSERLQSPNAPVPGGNYGYNLTTRAGRSQLAWQSNPNNPTGAASIQKTLQPKAQPITPAATNPTYANAQTGQQNAQAWMQNNQQAQTQAATPRPAANQPVMVPVNALRNGINTGETRIDVQGGTFGSQLASNPAGMQVTGRAGDGNPVLQYIGKQPQVPFSSSFPVTSLNQTQNASTQAATENAALNDFKMQQNLFDAQSVTAEMRSGIYRPKITDGQISGLASMYPDLSTMQIRADLAKVGYVPDVRGDMVRLGDASSQGGPVPSGYGDFAGLPAYEPPPPGYNDGGGYGGGGRRRNGGNFSPDPRQNNGPSSTSATWRIGL